MTDQEKLDKAMETMRLVKHLIEIIEGPFGWATARSAHGRRLKDMPEYVAVYLAVKDFQPQRP